MTALAPAFMFGAAFPVRVFQCVKGVSMEQDEICIRKSQPTPLVLPTVILPG